MSISKTIRLTTYRLRKFLAMHKRSLLCCSLFVINTLILVAIYIASRAYPAAVYKYYTTSLFKIINFIPKAISKIWPFSIIEAVFIVFIIFLLIFTIIVIIKTIKAIIHRNSSPATHILKYGAFVLKTLCVLLSTFILCGAFNYNSLPLADVAGYEVRQVDTGTLAALCMVLEDKASENYTDYSEVNLFELLDEAENTYKKARENYLFLENYTNFVSAPKPAILSTGMCYLQISGIYPIIYPESVVNHKIPYSTLPHTICHELAHQIGFAREDEANYVAFIACISSSRQEFIYSGYYEAFLYCMNALYQYDYDRWLEIYQQTDPRIIEDMHKSNEFWDSYKTPNNVLGNLSDSVNDAYLNSNNVQDGVHSYGRVVDLLLAEFLQDYGF